MPQKMPPTMIDVRHLTDGEVEKILTCYEQLVEAMKASNNTLIMKLGGVPGLSVEHATILNDWSAFQNQLFHFHSLEVEKAASEVH